ncbi:MAG: phytase [Oceanicaulis sp.]|nr:phytase [Oceanicaulis sp.]
MSPPAWKPPPSPALATRGDDPALWRAADPARSRILGTDKKSGLYIYTLDGETAQYLAAGRMNNVDVRYGFEAGDETVDIAVASDRTKSRWLSSSSDRETER